MIEEPPLLHILGESARNRPDANALAPFDGAETGQICDALGGIAALDAAIKPVGRLPERVFGPALTVDCGPADVLAVLAALAEARAGDVLVVATGGYRGTAVMGDQVAGMMRNAGVAGLVTDGMVRDIAGIEKVGLPVFAGGITPNSPFGKGPGRIGFPVMVGGRRVCSGDLVVGDRDGVAIVPTGELAAAAAALAAVQKAEADLAAAVADGIVAPEAVRALLSGPQTVRE